MHKVTIPVVFTERFDREQVLSELRRAKADRVLFALGAPSMIKENRQFDLRMLRENIPLFRAAGLEIGIWFWTFWRNDVADTKNLLMAKADGEPRTSAAPLNREASSGIPGFGCPTSEEFVENSMEIIRELAECGPDLLLFDDDYRFGFFDKNIGCYCDGHMKMYRERLGYDISREELYKKVFSAEPNKERAVFLKCLGESLKNYAKRCRETVDSVDPNIRFGVCSVMSLWDFDGVDSVTIAKILAGNTRPLLRLIGAPYWAEGRSWNNRLQNVVELERMEYSWCEGEDIEIMPEGDVYPRPRYKVPSAFLEGFDTALRAADVGENSFKYMLDYVSSPTYETGYINAHVKNAPFYEAIESTFKGKTAVGVGVYEKMCKFADAELSDIAEPEEYVKDTFFSKGARMLADNTVPIVYGESDACVVFGENARDLPDSIKNKPLVLDIRAAKLLMKQGIDVGIKKIGDAIKPELLCYADQNEYTSSDYREPIAYGIEVRDGARALIYSKLGEKKYIDAFEYENADGQRFLVFAFDAAFSGKHRFRSYAMQKLLYRELEWLSGKPLPAKCAGNPDLYILTKRGDDGALAVGLWNFFADEICEPVIELDREYESVEFFGCTGRKEGNKLFLSPLGAFKFAFICAK